VFQCCGCVAGKKDGGSRAACTLHLQRTLSTAAAAAFQCGCYVTVKKRGQPVHSSPTARAPYHRSAAQQQQEPHIIAVLLGRRHTFGRVAWIPSNRSLCCSSYRYHPASCNSCTAAMAQDRVSRCCWLACCLAGCAAARCCCTLLLHVAAARRCCSLLLHFAVALCCCTLLLHVAVALCCCTLLLHVAAARCCCTLLLHVAAARCCCLTCCAAALPHAPPAVFHCCLYVGPLADVHTRACCNAPVHTTPQAQQISMCSVQAQGLDVRFRP
jgi:hypothetical protein